MDQQWVAQSLTIWGVVIAVLTAVLPAVAQVWPEVGHTITPEWIGALDTSVKNAITGVGVAVGSVMVLVDRFSQNAKKSLTLLPPK